MTRLWGEGAAIAVATNEAGQPTRLQWQGRVHRVQRIHQVWQVDTDWYDEAGQIRRAYWTVTTTSGLLCVLYQDLMQNRWYLSKIYD